MVSLEKMQKILKENGFAPSFLHKKILRKERLLPIMIKLISKKDMMIGRLIFNAMKMAV